MLPLSKSFFVMAVQDYLGQKANCQHNGTEVSLLNSTIDVYGKQAVTSFKITVYADNTTGLLSPKYRRMILKREHQGYYKITTWALQLAAKEQNSSKLFWSQLAQSKSLEQVYRHFDDFRTKCATKDIWEEILLDRWNLH